MEPVTFTGPKEDALEVRIKSIAARTAFKTAEAASSSSVLADVDSGWLAGVQRGHLVDGWSRLVPPVYGDPTLAKVAASGTPAGVIDELQAWGDDPSRNLLLFGPVGTGKTFTAWAALRKPFVGRHRIASIPVVDLMDAFRPGGDPKISHDARTADLLFIDDLGANRGTEWTDERLYQLVHHRWERQLPIVATSNAARITGLAEVVGERIASRLGDGALLLTLTGQDRRRGAAA